MFPSDIPYMGSEFYFAHADVRGDDEQDEQVCQPDAQSAYQGFWEYPDGTILEISNAGWWNTYMADEFTPFAGGPVEYDEEAVYLMNDDGSSGGGRAYFDENGNLIESGYVLTYLGLYR